MAVYQTLTLKETKVDTLANTSSVQILWKSQQTGESHNDITRTAKYWITVNGTRTEYSVSYTLPAKTSKTILNRAITVPHKDDGSGSVKVETWMDTRISAGEVKLSKTLTLTAIARASTIGATDAFVESTAIVAVNRKSEEYTHSIAFSFGELTGYIDSDGNIVAEETKYTATNIPFSIPAQFYQHMTDRKSQTCQLVCRTYQGDTQIGSDQSASFTVTAKEDLCKPSVRGSVQDVNPVTLALTGDADTLVRHMSTARCAISAEAKNYANITALMIEGGKTAGVVEIPNVQTGVFAFRAEDSRGYANEATVPKTLIPYVPLTINAKITRTDPTSGNATLEVSGKCFVGNFGAVMNGITVYYRIGGADPVAVDVQTDSAKQVYSATANVPGLDYSSSHSMVVEVFDVLGKVSQALQVKPGIPVFDWGQKDFSFHVPVSVEGNLDMNGYAIGNIKWPRDDTDAANKAYVDSQFRIEKVWENDSPTSNFEEQTIDIPFSHGEMAMIFFAEGIDTAASCSAMVQYGKSGRILGKYGDFLTHRTVMVEENGVFISAGNRMLTYGNWSATDKVLIPVSVYKVTGIVDPTAAADIHAICGTFLCGEVFAGQ